MTAAENVSRNVRRLRLAHGWTQAEASDRFEQLTQIPMTHTSWSYGEQVGTRRQRAWTANDVAGLALLFGVPVGDLFADELPCPTCDGRPPAGYVCRTCWAGDL